MSFFGTLRGLDSKGDVRTIDVNDDGSLAVDGVEVLQEILKQMKIMNTHLSMITGEVLSGEDVCNA